MLLVAIAAAAVGQCPSGYTLIGGFQVVGNFDATACCSEETDYDQCRTDGNFYAIENPGKNTQGELCRPATAETPCCWSLYDGSSGFYGQIACVSLNFFDYTEQVDLEVDDPLGFGQFLPLLKCDADVAYDKLEVDDAEASELHVSSVNCFPADNSAPPENNDDNGQCPNDYTLIRKDDFLGHFATACCSEIVGFDECSTDNRYKIENAGKNRQQELCHPATAETPCCFSLYDASNDEIFDGLVLCTSSEGIDTYLHDLDLADEPGYGDSLSLVECSANVAYGVFEYEITAAAQVHVSSVNCFPADNNGSPPPSPPPSPGLSGAAIGGIVGGSIGGVLLIGGAVYLYTRKRGNAVNYVRVDENL